MADSETANELETLLPDHELTLAGESVTVREYRFLEGMQAGQIAGDLLDSLLEQFSDDFPAASMSALSTVFASNADAVAALIAMSCDRPIEWVAALPDEEGQVLLLTWWVVNKNFFMSRLIGLAADRQQSQPAATWDGVVSSPA